MDKIIKSTIQKLIRESVNDMGNDVCNQVISQINYSIEQKEYALTSLKKRCEKIKELLLQFNNEILHLGFNFSSITDNSTDDEIYIQYHIENSENWTDNDYESALDKIPYFEDDALVYYSVDKASNGYVITLESAIYNQDID